MPCINCRRTVQALGIGDRRIFWCPSCGSVSEQGMEENKTEAPALLDRVRIAADKAHAADLENVIVPAVIWRAVREAAGLGG